MEEQIKQVLIGSLLGDGSLSKTTTKNPKFSEEHNLKQKNYLLWKKKILEKEFDVKISFRKKRKFICLYSKTYHILVKYYNLFYPDKKGTKFIPIKVLRELKPLGLAVWYLDDGNYNYWSSSCCICIKKKINEKKLKEIFRKKFDINISRIDKKRGIYFNVEETKKFIKLIEKEVKQMPKDMFYKIGLDIIKRKRDIKKRNKTIKRYRKTPRAKEKISNWRNNNKEKIKEYKKREYLKCKEKKICPRCYKKTENYVFCKKCMEKRSQSKKLSRLKKKKLKGGKMK